ncbi:hypothetical protein AB1N83_011693 [Pleurotus pulmonarius]
MVERLPPGAHSYDVPTLKLLMVSSERDRLVSRAATYFLRRDRQTSRCVKGNPSRPRPVDGMDRKYRISTGV